MIVSPARQATFLELRSFELLLALPLSVNDAWHQIPKTGGKALTAEHRQFRTNTISRFRAAYARVEPLAGRLHMSVTLRFSNRRRTDIDNRIKPLWDALTSARAFHDDSQIDSFEVVREIHPEEGCIVKIQEIGA